MSNNMRKSEIVIELNNPNNDPLTKNIDSNSDNGRRINYKYEPMKKKKSIFKRTTKIEKIIGVLVLTITVVFIILFTVGSKTSSCKLSQQHQETERTDICYSFECIESAATILNTMDQSIDPCDDFYNFACGNFLKTNSIPDDKTAQHIFAQLDDILQEQIKHIIVQETNENDIRPFKMVKEFFQACMNTTKIEDLGLEAITKISDKMGGWPVVKGNDWDESSWNWEDIIGKFRKFGILVDRIVFFTVSVDVKNNSRKLIDIDQPNFGIEREYLINGLDDPIVKYYYNYMVDIAVLFGANEQRARNELKDSLEFEINLAKISLSSAERRNITKLYNIMPISEIQSKYPYINWLNFFNNLLHTIKVNETEIINLTTPSYFKQLEFLLKTTPKKTVANYLLWSFYETSVPYSVQKIRDRESKYNAEIYGKKEGESRWKECLRKTRNTFNIAVGALYVRKYFNEKSKASVLEIVKQIQQAFRNILLKVDWMDETTRKAALLKLDNMNNFIGYPNELMDDQIINDYYANLEINKNLYFESILNITKFDYNAHYIKLREVVDRTDWRRYSDATVINAFYSPLYNYIHFPAGILQNKFYSLNRPYYINFGGIGFIIGHEITHGFDDQGRQFDSNGELVDWWANDTKNLFSEKAQCIIEQYGNYVEKSTGLKLNGINTQGENIADNGGVKEAYFAYKNWVSLNGPEAKLPGLQNFTANQMFWISAAQNWCSLERAENLKITITTETHPPSYFRVVGSVSNMKEFSIDFKCKEGAKMNPIKKCQVW